MRVVEVVKGDELLVDKQGSQTRLRLVGVYAFSPVINDPSLQEQGSAAKAYVADQLLGKEVTVVLNKPAQDNSGRYLGFAHLGGADIGQQIIGEGHGIVYTEFAFPREQDYLQAEALARGTGRFIWGNEQLAKTARGLRKQWQEVRGGGGSPLQDPLLALPPPAPQPESERQPAAAE